MMPHAVYTKAAKDHNSVRFFSALIILYVMCPCSSGIEKLDVNFLVLCTCFKFKVSPLPMIIKRKERVSSYVCLKKTFPEKKNQVTTPNTCIDLKAHMSIKWKPHHHNYAIKKENF